MVAVDPELPRVTVSFLPGTCSDRAIAMNYFIGHPGEWKTYPSLCLKPKNFRSVGMYSDSLPDAFVGTKT